MGDLARRLLLAGSCPECRAGKHDNCTHESFDAARDTFYSCACEEAYHDE